MTLKVSKVPDRWMALGLAAHFVARHDTFGRFPASDLIRTLSSQVDRGHYLFAFDTETKPARVVGYYGWALYDGATAESFAATGAPPPPELGTGGDVLWILTAVADSRGAFFTLMKNTRALYPNHRVMAVRHKPGRRVILDQSRSRVSARKRVEEVR
jgi:hemolysin-activating ACP:hemolysin acyltransferase